jgi:hypothetical protein
VALLTPRRHADLQSLWMVSAFGAAMSMGYR